jgi:hypothetical protein
MVSLARFSVSDQDFIDIAPAPILARLDRLHDRMLGPMKMFRRMLVLGGVTAAHMAANETHSEMDPGIAYFQTFLASISARMHLANFFYVHATVCSHPILLVRQKSL